MFNLIMRWFEWGNRNATIGLDRLFEYTEDQVADQFRVDGNILLDRLARLPCLFMNEGRGDEEAFVGSVIRPRIANREIHFEYTVDADVPPLQNRVIYANRNALDMPEDFEFSRNHWAVKDVDLYRFLFRNNQSRRQRPSVFRIEDFERIEPTLASAMMPFDAGFNDVYAAIRLAATNAGLVCRRADDIWENPAIMQDVVSLSHQSRALQTPDEVLNAPPDTAFIFTDALGHPVHAQRKAYYEQPFMAGRYHPNPYHPPADRVRVTLGLGRSSWLNVRREAVPRRFAHFPQYANGQWSVVR